MIQNSDANWMYQSPQTPLVPQAIAGVPLPTTPPRLGKGRGSSRDQQPYQRSTTGRLLKKDPPVSPEPPSHHLSGLTRSFTSGRLVLRRSTEAWILQETGRAALLEMLVSNPLPCHTSCHQRRTARRKKTQSRRARPEELGDRLHVATGANSKQALPLHLNLLLYREIRHPSTTLQRPARAPSARVAGSGPAESTLNGGGRGTLERGGRVSDWAYSSTLVCLLSKLTVV
jgi:hypothetical protein